MRLKNLITELRLRSVDGLSSFYHLKINQQGSNWKVNSIEYGLHLKNPKTEYSCFLKYSSICIERNKKQVVLTFNNTKISNLINGIRLNKLNFYMH